MHMKANCRDFGTLGLTGVRLGRKEPSAMRKIPKIEQSAGNRANTYTAIPTKS